MFQLILKHKLGFFLVIASVTVAGLFELGQPLWIAGIIDQVFLKSEWNQFPFLVWMFFLFLAASQIFRFLEMQFVERLSIKISDELRMRLWSQLCGARLERIRSKLPGQWTSLFCEDIRAIQDYFVEGIASFSSHGIFLLGILICVSVLDPRMFSGFALAAIFFIGTIPFKKIYQRTVTRSLENQEKLYGFLDEVLKGRKEIRQFRMGRAILAEASVILEAHKRALLSQARWGALFSMSNESLSWLLPALVLGLGGYQVLQGALSLGILVAFLEYSRRFFSPLREISERWNRFQSAAAAFRRLESQEKNLIPEHQSQLPFRGLFEGIQFREIHFSYDSGEEPVFENLNLRIEAGEKVVIAGPSGSGKSTLVKLLLALYKPQGGQILADGISLEEWNLQSLRRHFLWFSGDWKADRSFLTSEFKDGTVLLLDEVEKHIDREALADFCQSILAHPDLTVIWVSHEASILEAFPRVIRLNREGVVDDVKIRYVHSS